VPLPEGANKPSYYRWNWPKRAVKTTANDYRALFQLIETANLAETNGYAVKMEALIDVDEWMRIIAAEHFVGNWTVSATRMARTCTFTSRQQNLWVSGGSGSRPRL